MVLCSFRFCEWEGLVSYVICLLQGHSDACSLQIAAWTWLVPCVHIETSNKRSYHARLLLTSVLLISKRYHSCLSPFNSIVGCTWEIDSCNIYWYHCGHCHCAWLSTVTTAWQLSMCKILQGYVCRSSMSHMHLPKAKENLKSVVKEWDNSCLLCLVNKPQ